MMAQEREGGRLSLPNALSIARFPLAALFPLVDGVAARLAVVAAAAATDWIDGRIARSRHTTTRFGALLDPVADKTFMAVALGTLALEGRVPLWALPLLLMRELGVVIGGLALAATGRRSWVRARGAGKLTTWAQFAAIAAILFSRAAAVVAAPVVAVLGLLALYDYARAVGREPPSAAS